MENKFLINVSKFINIRKFMSFKNYGDCKTNKQILRLKRNKTINGKVSNFFQMNIKLNNVKKI